MSRLTTIDFYPKLPSSGFEPPGRDVNVAQCFNPITGERKRTPEHIKKYRQSYKQQPGIRVQHFGLKEDHENLDKNNIYGKASYASDHVSTVIKAQNMNGLADRFNDISESRYATKKREPLGKGFTRQYDWPEHLTNEKQHCFGKEFPPSELAKNLLFPANGATDEYPAFAQMYEKTHNNVDPGAQKKRNYAWGNIDPSRQVFGYNERLDPKASQKALQPERVDEFYPKTVVVSKQVEDYNAVHQDMLGFSKNLGQGAQPVLPESAQIFGYGVPSLKDKTEWNAARCLRGEPEERELKPDYDLGHSVKNNCTNMVRKPQDADRAFGCPTIRTDIPNPSKKSVADYQNYGDEPEAVDLLFPATNVEVGVSETDFLKLRPQSTLRALFEKTGYVYGNGKFNAIFNKSVLFTEAILQKSVPYGQSTVRGMMMAIAQLAHIE